MTRVPIISRLPRFIRVPPGLAPVGDDKGGRPAISNLITSIWAPDQHA